MEFSSGELTRDMGLPQGENQRINLEIQQENENRRLEGPTEGSMGGSNRHLSSTSSFVQLNDAADEFFDVPDESEYDQREVMFPSDESTHAWVSSLYLHDQSSMLITYHCSYSQSQFFYITSSVVIVQM